MNSYLLIRNNTYYFRRRISKKYLSFFEHKEELRIKLVTKSKIRAMIAIELINRAFEETIMLLNNHISTHRLCCPTPEILYDGNATALKYLLDKTADYAIMDKLEDFNIEQKQSVINNFELLNKLDSFMQLIDPKNLINQIQGTNKQAQQEAKTSISFKELYEIFIKEKKIESRDNEADIAESTWRDYKSSYNDFIYVIKNAEDKDIGEFTREDFRNYIEALHNHIPKSRTKLKQFRSLPYQELKEITLLDSEKMAHDTKKKKISTIKQIFDIAIDSRYAYISKNLAEGFLLKKQSRRKQESKTKRTPLTDKNLKKLFTSKIYTDKVQHTLKHEAEKYWIPLIAIYTGMRQNEICQLYVEDIKSEIISTGDEVFYFNLNEDKDKHLKNNNAHRKVPIHPTLVKLGLLDYINVVKKKHDRLWPNLELHPTEKRYGTLYSSRFSTFFRNYITKDKNQVFHCMRHNVSTQLLNNAVKYKIPKDLINRLMGHEPAEDETSQSYFDGYSIETLYEGIKTLDFKNQLFYDKILLLD